MEHNPQLVNEERLADEQLDIVIGGSPNVALVKALAESPNEPETFRKSYWS
jgi:hypothetical protein